MIIGGKAATRPRTRRAWRILATILFLALALPTALGAQTFKNLAQARQAAAGATTQDALKSVVFAAIAQLSIRDGITFCREVEPKAGATLKAELRGTLGSLYLLLGQTADAASWYAKAAALDPKYGAEAARLAVATGDTKTADALASAGGISKETRALLEVWGLLLDGSYESASVRVKEALATSPNAQVSSELLFLQYIADFGRYGAAKPNITREYPSSMGSDLISGKVFPEASFLLALGLSWTSEAAPLQDYRAGIGQWPKQGGTPDSGAQASKEGSASGSSTQPPKESAQSSKESAPPAKEGGTSDSSAQWLQVGYFSLRENAQRLSAVLASKHFESRVVEMKNKDGEMRWLVQVAAEKDWQKTQAALKDLGYESYLISP